jgi:predicted Zn finger-like uncharacterized protein
MIAACPRCAARYRIEKEKLRGDGVRLRCAKCDAVFRVRPPAEEEAIVEAAPIEARRAPAPAPAVPAPAPRVEAPAPVRPLGDDAPTDLAAELVLIGIPSPETAKRLETALVGWGLRAAVVADGVEAMLEIQRKLPRAAVLSAALPRMYGFQVCEIVKRNESLSNISVVLVGSIHNQDRYRRPPEELYGADAYVEEPDLPDGLLPVLQRLGISVRSARGARREAPAEAKSPAPVHREAPPAAPRQAPRPAPVAQPPVDDGLGEQRQKAERLARIIVSDIVLYNEEKFAAAVRAGNVLEALTPDLAEGRGLFRERIDERVRAEKDHLAEELLRVARTRG